MEIKLMNREYKCKKWLGTLKWAHWKQKWKNHWTGTLNDRDGRGKRGRNLGVHTTEVLSETLKQEDISWLSSGIILSY